jgi:ABC-type lipoprotein release transport system permease subunit
LVTSLLFEVKATNPWFFGFVFACIAAVALGASVVPAWRAARLDPIELLRAD